MFNDLSKMKAVVLCILLFLKSSSFMMYNILEKGQMKVFTCKSNNKDNSSNRLIKMKLRSFQKRGKGERPCSSERSKHAAHRDKYN